MGHTNHVWICQRRLSMHSIKASSLVIEVNKSTLLEKQKPIYVAQTKNKRPKKKLIWVFNILQNGYIFPPKTELDQISSKPVFKNAVFFEHVLSLKKNVFLTC